MSETFVSIHFLHFRMLSRVRRHSLGEGDILWNMSVTSSRCAGRSFFYCLWDLHVSSGLWATVLWGATSKWRCHVFHSPPHKLGSEKLKCSYFEPRTDRSDNDVPEIGMPFLRCLIGLLLHWYVFSVYLITWILFAYHIFYCFLLFCCCCYLAFLLWLVTFICR